MDKTTFVKNIDKIHKEIKEILDSILQKIDMEIILDSHEIDRECYNYIKKKDMIYFKMLFDIIKKAGEKDNFNIDLSLKEVKKYDVNNKSYQSLLSFIKEKYDIFNNLKKKVILNFSDFSDFSEDEEILDKKILDEKFIDEEIIDIKLKDIQNYNGLRKNQELAQKNNISNNFSSGIHNQVTGAGKSVIMMLTINDHYKLNKNNNKNNKGRLYIITCPRKEVLNKMFFEKSELYEYELNEENKEYWKKNKIIDLDEYKIIDRVNYKGKKKIKLSESKPNILIVNSDYFKNMDKEKLIDYDKLNFVIFDECHGVSAKNFYELLYKIKFNKKKHIIGFSATPVRDNAEDKVKRIFSKSLNNDKKYKHSLNIISNYDIMEAICDNIVLPPSYTIVEINKTCNKKIGKSNKDITEKVIKDILKDLPYKKIICWCGTILKMKEWYIFFTKKFPELKLYCSSSKDEEHEKENLNTDFDKFCEAEKNSILLCVNRCREGSDIKNLDMGVYLDHVKKRGILVCIQTVGRILRPDKKKLKKSGYIVDTFINDGKIEIEVMTADRIISYYEKVFGLTCDDTYNDLLEKYKKIKELFTEITYDEKTNEIKIKIDSNEEHNSKIKLELTTKKFDWSKFTQKISSIIDKKFCMNDEEKFNIIIEKSKTITNEDKDKDVLRYKFTYTNITKVKLYDKVYNISAYSKLIEHIYILIKNYELIKKNTCLNIVKGKKEDKGYYYIDKINISYQRACANKSMKEIITQLKCNNITYVIEIQSEEEKPKNKYTKNIVESSKSESEKEKPKNKYTKNKVESSKIKTK